MLMEIFENIYLDLCLALSSMMHMLSKYVRSVVYRACSGESLLSSTIDCIDCKGTAVSGKGVTQGSLGCFR